MEQKKDKKRLTAAAAKAALTGKMTPEELGNLLNTEGMGTGGGTGGGGGTGMGTGDGGPYSDSCTVHSDFTYGGVNWTGIGSASCVVVIEDNYLRIVSFSFAISINGGSNSTIDEEGNEIIVTGNSLSNLHGSSCDFFQASTSGTFTITKVKKVINEDGSVEYVPKGTSTENKTITVSCSFSYDVFDETFSLYDGRIGIS